MVRQGLPEHGVQDAEQAGGRANAQGEGRDGEQGDKGAAGAEAQAVAKVLGGFFRQAGRHREYEIGQDPGPVARLFAEGEKHFPLTLLAEADRIEAEQSTLELFTVHAGSPRPKRTAESSTSSRMRAASACATARPNAVIW